MFLERQLFDSSRSKYLCVLVLDGLYWGREALPPTPCCSENAKKVRGNQVDQLITW